MTDSPLCDHPPGSTRAPVRLVFRSIATWIECQLAKPATRERSFAMQNLSRQPDLFGFHARVWPPQPQPSSRASTSLAVCPSRRPFFSSRDQSHSWKFECRRRRRRRHVSLTAAGYANTFNFDVVIWVISGVGPPSAVWPWVLQQTTTVKSWPRSSSMRRSSAHDTQTSRRWLRSLHENIDFGLC